jgi:hypothetical protein
MLISSCSVYPVRSVVFRPLFRELTGDGWRVGKGRAEPADSAEAGVPETVAAGAAAAYPINVFSNDSFKLVAVLIGIT